MHDDGNDTEAKLTYVQQNMSIMLRIWKFCSQTSMCGYQFFELTLSWLLHRPLQIPQYNTTCAINYLVTIPQNIRYSFTKFIVLFMFTQH